MKAWLAAAILLAGCAAPARTLDVRGFQVGIHAEDGDVSAGDGVVVWTFDGERYSLRHWPGCTVKQRRADAYTRAVVTCGTPRAEER